MSTQFIACNAENCPLNESKQCRAPWIVVDESGKCVVKEQGPHDGKSETEKYVELAECRCEDCRHWELDERTLLGQCGAGVDLFFRSKLVENMADKNNPLDTGAFCIEFEKQIEEPPPFNTSL